MIKGIEILARAGFALHWRHPKSKRPIGKERADRPVVALDGLHRTFKDGNNVGVRLGKWSVVSNLLHSGLGYRSSVAYEAEEAAMNET